jgi:anti-anti-sigma factor
MTSPPELATANLTEVAPGTHLCAFYDSEERLGRIASTFAASSLAAGDRLLYVAEDGDVATEMLGSLLGERQPRALASGQLHIRTFADTYGRTYAGDLAPLEAGFRAAAAQAHRDGFPGLRVAAETGDLVRLLGSSAEALRWEQRSTAIQRDIGVSSVCQYDLRHLSPADASLLAAEHTALSPDRGDPPMATFLAVGDPWGLEVTGEVDISNRAALVRAVRARAESSARVHLDLGGLTFADVGAVHGLCSVAATLPRDGHLVLRRTPDFVRRVLDLTGLAHRKLVVEP